MQTFQALDVVFGLSFCPNMIVMMVTLDDVNVTLIFHQTNRMSIEQIGLVAYDDHVGFLVVGTSASAKQCQAHHAGVQQQPSLVPRI